MDSIEQEVLTKIANLIEGNISREAIDNWSQLRGEEIQKILAGADDPRSEALSDLIDAMSLVVTPNEHGGWLYTQDDFETWLHDYQNAQ
jgi:hypothetical protein